MSVLQIAIKTYGIRCLVALICAVPLSAEAETLYVNGTTGNDAISYASNSESTPWRTIGRAAWGSTNRSSPNPAQAAQAGDIVLIAAGTYATAGSNSRSIPAYNPANSGTPGNPITFQATGVVTLTLSSSRGSVIGAYERDYIQWKGFTINERNAPSAADTGSVTFWFSTGSSAENLILDGNGDPGFSDNHPGIRIENCDNITIRNNIIQDYRTSGVNLMNGAGVQVYNAKGLLIEHNEIFDSGTGIYLKAIGFSDGNLDPTKYSDQMDVIRYNLIHHVRYGLLHLRHIHTASTVYVLWYQNIVHDADGGGIALWGFPGDGPSNARFINNTIYRCYNGIYMLGAPITNNWNNQMSNNLITASTYLAVYNEATSGDVSFELDRVRFSRNWYWSFPAFLRAASGTYTLTGFQGRYAGQETGGTSGIDPRFVNASSLDFHLNSGSPARTAGQVVHSIGGTNGATIPVGAYITGNEVIGLASGSSAQPPAVVQNLRIIP